MSITWSTSGACSRFFALVLAAAAVLVIAFGGPGSGGEGRHVARGRGGARGLAIGIAG